YHHPISSCHQSEGSNSRHSVAAKTEANTPKTKMNKLTRRYLLALLSLLPLGVGPLMAQTVPSKTAAPNANSNPATPIAEDEVVMLDPFTVSTDTEGYMARDTLGGARIRTSLKDTPSAISIITPKFMQDLGITKSED